MITLMKKTNMKNRWSFFGNWVRSLSRDDSGVYAVEFALLAVPFFTVLCATAQYSYYYFTTAILQQMTERAARALLTGAVQTGGPNAATNPIKITSSAQFISDLLCPSTLSSDLLPNPYLLISNGTRSKYMTLFSSMIDCTLLSVDVEPASSWSVSSVNIFGGNTQYCVGTTGGAGGILVITVGYKALAALPISFPNPTGYLIKGSNSYYQGLVAAEVIRTEDFTAAVVNAGC